MNTKELVLRIAARADCTQAQARLVLKALGEELEAALAEGEEVRLAGLGTFSQSWTEPRLVRGIGQGRRRLVETGPDESGAVHLAFWHCPLGVVEIRLAGARADGLESV